MNAHAAPPWAAVLPQVLQLSQAAGEAIMQFWERGRAHAALIAAKDDLSPLTQADLASHQLIVAGLSALTPHIPVVSEEDVASMKHRRPTGMFWLIDPLDGTKEFLAQSSDFTVNIALVSDAIAVWGVVHAPALGQSFWGGAAFGTKRQAQGPATDIHVAAPPPPGRPLRVVASKSHLDEATAAFIAERGLVQLVQAGSSLKFCRVAEGEADLYPRFSPTCEWDTAAAQAVLEGAGGEVLDLQGAPLRYGKPDVLNPGFIAAPAARNLAKV